MPEPKTNPINATWTNDGQPEDLRAAAYDALEWLYYLRRWPGRTEALDRCIDALENHLSHPEGGEG